MQFSNRQLEDLKKLYLKYFAYELTDDEAKEKGLRLVLFVKRAYMLPPNPREGPQ